MKIFKKNYGLCLPGVVVSVLHCEIIASLKSSQAIMFTFGQIPFGKGMNPLNLFTNPSTRAGYDTRSNFKWSLTGLNSQFPSPRPVASSRLKNLVCPNIYPWLEGE